MDLSPVTYMSPSDLFKRLSASVDAFEVDCVEGCESPVWCDIPSHFPAKFSMLMDKKFEDCSEDFLSSIINEGARKPVCIEVNRLDSDYWRFGNGHHRMAVYLKYGLENLPVVFSFDGDYMWSGVSGSYDTDASNWGPDDYVNFND
jgi:hypothetical protein